MTENLDSLSTKGHTLLSQTNKAEIEQEYSDWVKAVTAYLIVNHPNTGLVSQWQSLANFVIDKNVSQYLLSYPWQSLESVVKTRLNWLSDLPRKAVTMSILNKPMNFEKSPQLTKGPPQIKQH